MKAADDVGVPAAFIYVKFQIGFLTREINQKKHSVILEEN